MEKPSTDQAREVDEATLFGALENDTSRAILAHTSNEALSANELADRIDVSLTTIYRKLEQLTADNLVQDMLQLDQSGDHYRVYRTRLKRINVVIDEEVQTHVEWREDMADRFTRIWEEIRR